MRAGLSLLVLLGLVLPAWGQVPRRPLGWEYARSFIPPVTGFVLTAVDGRGGIQQFQVALSEPGACDRGVPLVLDDTFCTTVPCPAGGSITAYWVSAWTPTAISVPSNILTCWTPPHTSACPCLDPGQAPPGQGLPPSTPPVLPPPPQEPPVSPEPPPLPQRGPEGLNLQPIGELPALPLVPPIPASGGA